MAPTSDGFRHYAPRRAARELPFAGGFVTIAMAAIVFGAGIGIVGYFWSAPAPDLSQAVVAATTGPRAEPAPLPVADDGSWGDADLSHCSDEASAAADEAAKRKLAAVSADRVGLGAPDAEMVRRAAFLLCSASHKPLHLCKAYWRGSIEDAIRVYAADFHKVKSSAYWTKVNLAERARQEAGADAQSLQNFADDLDQTTRDMMKMHDEITAALRSLVTDGIIPRDDFGNFFGLGVPPEIAAMLGDAKPVRQLCG
jgi:hypothetical protein